MKKIIEKTHIKNVLTEPQIHEFTKLVINKCIEICNTCFLDGNTNSEGVYEGNPAFEFEKHFRHRNFAQDNKYKLLKKMGVNLYERRDEIDMFATAIIHQASLVCSKHFVDGTYFDEPNEFREEAVDSDKFIKDLKRKLGASFVETYGREIFAEQSFYDADIGEEIRKKFKLK